MKGSVSVVNVFHPELLQKKALKTKSTFRSLLVMKTISYSSFIDDSTFLDYTIFYMPGLKVASIDYAKVIVNTDSKSAYVYCD